MKTIVAMQHCTEAYIILVYCTPYGKMYKYKSQILMTAIFLYAPLFV